MSGKKDKVGGTDEKKSQSEGSSAEAEPDP
jgi:hypothetical protein